VRLLFLLEQMMRENMQKKKKLKSESLKGNERLLRRRWNKKKEKTD